MNEWQPMERAPQDGSVVLLLVPTRYGKWGKTIAASGMWLGMWLIFNADEAVGRVEPIGWMPVPPPLETEG